jgi:hypothetical protein
MLTKMLTAKQRRENRACQKALIMRVSEFRQKKNPLNPVSDLKGLCNLLILLVGTKGFEPLTPTVSG